MGSKDNRDNKIIHSQTISDVIRGMQYAVNTAQETLQDYQCSLLERYFNNETGEPIMKYVRLADGRQVEVPLVTLIPANMLTIDELEMDFSVHVASADIKLVDDSSFGQKPDGAQEAEADDTNKTTRSAFNVFFSGTRHGGDDSKKSLFSRDDKQTTQGSDVIDIHIKFKSVEEPEAAARIREMLNNQVQ